MKSEPRPTRNNLSLRRIRAVRLCLIVVLCGNLVVGWFIWRQTISGEAAWILPFLFAGLLTGLMIALPALNRRAPVEPIRGIAAWASRIRQGDFSARLEEHSGLRVLTDDINRLAEWLESLAESKHRELLEQGARLRTHTNMMRLLYDISGDFSHNATAAELLERTLRPMAAVLEARRIAFHRLTGDHGPAPLAAWDAAGRAAAPAAGECVKIPLYLGGNARGECHIWFAAERLPLPDEFSQLLYTLVRNIGTALERIDLHQESARLSRMRERSRLANELHDSLAQTIAGLRFQVRILDDLLHQREEHAAWRQLETVENLVEEANDELRSLIGCFRVPIDPGGLRPAIEAAVTRFRGETEIPLFFQDQWGALEVPEKWQSEIVRIIQEALNNIRRHSRAKNARVLLRRDAHGGAEKYTALVEDDGVGTAPGTDTGHPGEHIGLSVMAQRARSIGAGFQVESEPGEGTRVVLTLRPVPKRVPERRPTGRYDGAP